MLSSPHVADHVAEPVPRLVSLVPEPYWLAFQVGTLQQQVGKDCRGLPRIRQGADQGTAALLTRCS